MTTKRRTVSFAASPQDRQIINKIAGRASTFPEFAGTTTDDKASAHMSTAMDLTACHLNGNPLRLADLLAAPDFDFLHDVAGIYRHINRETGELRNSFSPRFSL